MTRELFYKFCHGCIEWMFRPRTIAFTLIKYGAYVFVAALATDYFLQVDFKDQAGTWRFSFATGEGIPKWAVLGAYATGVLMMVFGVAFACHRALAEIKSERRKMLIVIELRGLHSSPDTPAIDAKLAQFAGKRERVLIDFRPQNAADLVDPNLLLAKLQGLNIAVQTLSAGRDKSDVFVAIGGLAAVPSLFLAGMLIDDESHATIYDWDRNGKSWRVIDGPDDDTRFLPLTEPAAPTNFDEVVLAVAISYPINEEALLQTFPGVMPVFRLTAAQLLADRHWSANKQQAMTATFRDVVQTLLAKGVRKVHLILAAPSSLAIRFGMAYDKRLMPDVVVYQYEKSSSPPYPWGIQMPNHRTYEGKLVSTPPVQITAC